MNAESIRTVCVICGKPITQEQRPSIRMQPGKEAHMGCWVKRERNASKPN